MPAITRDDVLKVLAPITAPGAAGNIVDRGLVSEIVINGSDVMFALSADPGDIKSMETARRAAENAVKTLPGA